MRDVGSDAETDEDESAKCSSQDSQHPPHCIALPLSCGLKRGGHESPPDCFPLFTHSGVGKFRRRVGLNRVVPKCLKTGWLSCSLSPYQGSGCGVKTYST